MKPAHCMIHVRHLDRAVDFYGRALGFREVDRHRYDGATLVYLRGAASSFEIELIQPDRWPFESSPETGRTHIAFVVDDLDHELARLGRIGIETDPIIDHVANGAHQTRYFYVSDLEGNQIEFLEANGRYAGE